MDMSITAKDADLYGDEFILKEFKQLKNKAIQTKVKVKCVSKKESANWDKTNPIQTAIEVEVPYDQKSIYWKLSGGTNMVLNTCNKDAADMFIIGQDYDIVI